MTKLRRSGSMDFGRSNIVDVAKAVCLACKQRSKPRRSCSLFHIKTCAPLSEEAIRRAPPRAGGGMEAAGEGCRSLSVSSEGSAEGHLVEQEDIVVLTHDVRSFKEALGRLRRIFHPDRDRSEAMRVSGHERLGEVLRILRSILEKYPPIQSTELLMTAGQLIQQVKSYNYEDEKSDPSEFFDAIDQLALAFSSRVSEYLMGDLDNSTQPVPKTRSCDNLLSSESECDPFIRDKRFAGALQPEEIDGRLARLSDGVDLALRRAKVWSKYAKDVMTYIEKRCIAEAEHAKNLVKLAQTMRPILKEESFLPFQSIYYMALDQDYDSGQTSLKTCAVLQGHKFIEPLTARRNEHERYRKQIKETWHRELKKMHESVSNLRKAKALYYQRQQDYEKAKESAQRAESSEGGTESSSSKVDKKRRVEDDALQRAMEAETTYKSCVLEANEKQLALQKVKGEVLQQVRELIYQCDQTMKAVTVGYFQLQSTLSAHAPVQFQTLCESSRLYEPGTQYMEFVKRLPQPTNSTFGDSHFAFEPYFSTESRLDKTRKSNGSTESSEDILNHSYLESRYSSDSKAEKSKGSPLKSWSASSTQGMVTGGSDSDSMSSCPSNKSQDTSPAASPHISVNRKSLHVSSGDELETDHDNLDNLSQVRRPCMSKAAETHTFRRLKTPSRCRECDSYVYFHGFECLECGLASHKKCLDSLAIQCGRKRLPRKMTTFGVDLTTNAHDSGEEIPYIVRKCVAEVENKGFELKGIYRVSGVKSKVEKLCQSFENGAELVDLEGVHPNVVSNVLKLYLRQLPEPLLTYRLYPDFIKIAKDYPAQKVEGSKNGVSTQAIQDLRRLVEKLPDVHLATLAFLMHHLYRVSKHCDQNNMPPSNLGIVFGPTLLRTSEGSASLSSLVDTVHQTRVIELLITYTYEIFGPPWQITEEEVVKSNVNSEKCSVPSSNELEEPLVIQQDIVDLEEYSLSGYLSNIEKTFDTEYSQHNYSSDDLLYQSILSEDDFPEVLLSEEDPLFKKSSGKSKNEMAKAGSLMRVQESRASLSSSPAVSEASHCSSLLRSTDDESVSDNICKEGVLPIAPLPRKVIPPNVIAYQKASQAKAISESSGVWSSSSTSPTAATDSSQNDINVYTSTTVVTLASQSARTSTSSITAELRRQFFELPISGLPRTIASDETVPCCSELSKETTSECLEQDSKLDLDFGLGLTKSRSSCSDSVNHSSDKDRESCIVETLKFIDNPIESQQGKMELISAENIRISEGENSSKLSSNRQPRFV